MKLIATTAVRGSRPGESHGAAYLVDLDNRTVEKPLDWNRLEIDWRGQGGDRGLRGIGFDQDLVYVAASDELLAYRPDFTPVGSWRNPYLRHCHQICVHERTLFLTSTAFDCVLAFDLDKRAFARSIHIESGNFQYRPRGFDPDGGDGPLELNKLHVNSIACNRHGMYLGGLHTGGMLHFNGRTVLMSAEVPGGSHDLRPFRDGVLFNDNDAGRLRYCGRGGGREDRALAAPECDPAALPGNDPDIGSGVRPGFLRGLCALSGSVVAGGSSPATVSVYDLPANERLLSVNLSPDVRATVHGLEIWPYD